MGVDYIPEAIENARDNAKINNVENSIFYEGKAEDNIYNMLELNDKDNCIAVVDPPRAGVRKYFHIFFYSFI